MKIISLTLSALLLLGTVPASALEAAAAEKEYFIEAGDVISVNVFPAQEFSKEVTVQPDGNIEIPLLGSMRAQGIKPGELEKMLTAKFSKYVSNPSITLNVRRFSFNRVALIGQVKSPGYHEFREGMRLLDLVALAGGTADYSRDSKVRIYRKIKGEGDKLTEVVIKANLEDVFDGKMESNIPLMTGDIVYIPRKPYSAAARWITDNVVPWATLFVFAITAGLVARNN
ncbi:MAG: polysaccharide biosynthesis/export family protein [Elusimicrobiales bacterium]